MSIYPQKGTAKSNKIAEKPKKNRNKQTFKQPFCVSYKTSCSKFSNALLSFVVICENVCGFMLIPHTDCLPIDLLRGGIIVTKFFKLAVSGFGIVCVGVFVCLV